MTGAETNVGRAAKGASALVIVVALTVLIGWTIGSPELTSVGRGRQPMTPLSAFGLALTGIAALLLRSRRLRRSAVPFGALAALIGAVTLAEWVLGLRLGVDTMLFRDAVTAGGGSFPGRPAIATSLSLLFLGMSVMALATMRRPVSGHMLAVIAIIIGLIAILGAAYGVQSLYGISVTTSIAVHTSISLLLAGFALLVVDAPHGLSAVFIDNTAGGRLARILLPVSLLVPLAIGALNIRGQAARLYDARFGVSLTTGLAMISFGAVVWLSANRVSRLDRQRRASDRELRELQASLDAHVSAAGRDVGQARTLEVALHAILDAAARVAKVERVVYSTVEDGTKLHILAAVGAEGLGDRTGAVHDIAGQPMLAELRAGRTFRNLDTSASHDSLDELAARVGVASFVIVPELARGELHATLGFAARVSQGFDDEAIAFLETLGRECSGPLNTLRTLEREQETTRRLRELDELKNDFVGMVAHDLRSPMTVVKGFADMLAQRWTNLDDMQRLEMIGRIRGSMSRLSNLVTDILEVARIESGTFEYNLEPTDLVELARRTLDEQRLIHPDQTYVLEAGDDLPPATADPQRAWRILTNLLSNAQRFSPADSPIEVTVRRVDQTIEVGVTDHGPGIPAADVPKLFQRFSRLSASGTNTESTGLGLFICRSLVEGQNGRIWVHSEPDVRTTFSFSLPLQEGS